MKIDTAREYIKTAEFAEKLADTLSVSSAKITKEIARYDAAIGEFVNKYGERDISVYSIGGRSEISGNHTDHNHGKVIAAAVNLDILAIAAKADNDKIRVKSAGFDEDVVKLSDADEPKKTNYFHSSALIAGMVRAFRDRGLNVGGFVAYTQSSVFKGSGVSSSAAFEVMIGNILNHLYNDGRVSEVEIAKMAQFSENVFFGKPCGLMDQTACAVGGFITIDFADPSNPKIEKSPFDLNKEGYSLCIVNTGGNHADLNEDYASVPAEMKSVARELGVEYLRDTDRETLVRKLCEDKTLRLRVGDRAILRALHFFDENDRVTEQMKALDSGDTPAFLRLVRESGLSSFRFLQNVYTTKNVREQGLSLALCVSEDFLAARGGVSRVHGGGFAGTIQAFVPNECVDEYKNLIDGVFGDGACNVLSVRKAGAVRLF